MAVCLLLALSTAFELHAQQAAEGSISAEISAFAVMGGPDYDLFIQNQGEETQIAFRSDTRSNLIDYRGPNPLTFYRKVTKPDGTMERVRVATASLPQGISKALLLFIPEKWANGTADKYYVAVAADDVGSLPRGSLRIFNGTGSPVYAIIGEQKAILEPGFSSFYDLMGFHGRERTRMVESSRGLSTETDVDSTAPIRLARKIDDRYEHVYDSPLRIHPKSRYVLLVFQAPGDKTGNRLYSRIIYELIP